MDITTFRQQFPEFASPSDYPDPQVSFWLGLAVKQLNAARWFDLLDQGLALYTAHHLALQRRDIQAAALGGAPGANAGVLASKSVDKVAASYDTNAGTYEGAGFWNLTTYGTQYWNLLRMVGAVGLQL